MKGFALDCIWVWAALNIELEAEDPYQHSLAVCKELIY